MPSIRLAFGLLAAALTVAGGVPSVHGDTVELVNGTKIQGTVVARDSESVTLQVRVGGRTFLRKYPLSRVRAVVVDEEAMESPGRGTKAGQATGRSARGTAAAADGVLVRRTRAEVEALIEQQGRTLPEWWESVPLEYPRTLDLEWPEPAPGPWNPQRNVGQYLWDVIHPNPSRWRQGIRFLHFLLDYHKENPEKQRQIMNALGQKYFVLLQDYARAAYWFRKAGVERDDRFWSGVQLAECYWRLGNKPMALELLDRIEPQFSMIKLLGDMGETERALAFARANTEGEGADIAYLYAGDACRVAGRNRQALQFYQKVLEVPAAGRFKARIERNHHRARANIEAIKLFDLLDLARVPDGTYRASSLGYEAPVHVEVVVSSGRIQSVRVIEHREKQFYSSMTDTPRKIMEKQGVVGIDATSGATITSEAIINATAKALAGAMQ